MHCIALYCNKLHCIASNASHYCIALLHRLNEVKNCKVINGESVAACSTECWCWTGRSSAVRDEFRAGDTEDQMVETERREPKDTVQGEDVE